MKSFFFGLSFLTLFFQTTQATSFVTDPPKTEQEITALSKQKWQWMSDKNVDKLNALFDEKAVFVHMGGSWGKSRKMEDGFPLFFPTLATRQKIARVVKTPASHEFYTVPYTL